MSTVAITFDGQRIEAEAGESLAAALAAHGIRVLRVKRSGAERGMFCGMGVCQDCLVEIDGRPNNRACTTKVQRPMTVERGSETRVARPTRNGAPVTIDSVPLIEPEILVVGGGPAGLAAAIAARRAGARVMLIDERSSLGGQYFKQLAADRGIAADRQHRRGEELIEEALRLGVDARPDMTVWGAFPGNELLAGANRTVVRFRPQRLILATGAYERAVPVPGWTLPGVMTTGAAQTLWRTARRLPGRRVLIAGNGPLNLQLATELLSGGAEVLAVVEAAAPFPRKPAALVRMAIASPALMGEGVLHRARLLAAGVPLVHGSVIRRIDSGEGRLEVRVAGIDGSRETAFRDVDAVCLGYGFEPSNELLRALDVRHDFDAARGYLVPQRDRDGRTSDTAIFAVGDCTGLGGANAALVEGRIAGTAAAADLGHKPAANELPQAYRALARHRRFQSALWQLFAAPRFLLELADRETILCRCEEVTVAAVEDALAEGYATTGDVKRRTRAGMGRCQGRYCGPILDALIAKRSGREPDEYSGFAPRAPARPFAIEDLLTAAEAGGG
jgi:NADPH-dependent 2,4-dienoyl-CoA reductase/sulfur reductase-like enzyme